VDQDIRKKDNEIEEGMSDRDFILSVLDSKKYFKEKAATLKQEKCLPLTQRINKQFSFFVTEPLQEEVLPITQTQFT